MSMLNPYLAFTNSNWDLDFVRVLECCVITFRFCGKRSDNASTSYDILPRLGFVAFAGMHVNVSCPQQPV